MSPICRLVKGWETRPTIQRPYQRRRESLTICRFYHKGSTFYSVIEPRPPAQLTDRRSTNWANRAAVIVITIFFPLFFFSLYKHSKTCWLSRPLYFVSKRWLQLKRELQAGLVITVKSPKGQRYGKFIKDLRLWTSLPPFNSDIYVNKTILSEVFIYRFIDILAFLYRLFKRRLS
jgi:hypothetical protein